MPDMEVDTPTEESKRARAACPDYVHQPVAGVKSDFEKLLTSFTETENVRFETFLMLWKEMKMPLIFSGRQSDRECREFTEECMKVALSFLLPPYNFQVRVGGLYLLYGLYFKQLFEPAAKIRLTFSQWKEIQLFIEEVKSQQHLDVEFVLSHLKYHNAFHFVANTNELCPMRESTNNVDHEEEVRRETLRDQTSVVSELLEPDNIDQLSAIHDQYFRMKCALAGPNAKLPNPSLNIIQPNLVQYITKSVASHEEWRKARGGRKGSGKKRRDSGGMLTTSESEADSEVDMPPRSPRKKKTSIGSVRAAIRDKAFSAAPTAGRSRRHRLSVRDSSDAESQPKSPRKSRSKADESSGIESDNIGESEEEPMMSPMSALSSIFLSKPPPRNQAIPESPSSFTQEDPSYSPPKCKKGGSKGKGRKGKSIPGKKSKKGGKSK